MKNFTEITNIDTSNPILYPKGSLKDASSELANDGTLFNRVFGSDQYQFFWKCVKDANITPNDVFDNVANGYQLFDAVQQAISGRYAGLFGNDLVKIKDRGIFKDNVTLNKNTFQGRLGEYWICINGSPIVVGSQGGKQDLNYSFNVQLRNNSTQYAIMTSLQILETEHYFGIKVFNRSTNMGEDLTTGKIDLQIDKF